MSAGRDRIAGLFVRLRDVLRWRTTNAVPYVDAAAAERQAAARAAAIHRRDRGRRFIEVPPEHASPRPWAPNHDPGIESILLERECRTAELLLLGRACDAVESVLRKAAGGETTSFEELVEDTQPRVTLRPLPLLLRRLRPRLYPWRVVLRTTDRALFVRHLSGLDDWLGVGVDVVKGRPSRS
jgi:hypothetical protein